MYTGTRWSSGHGTHLACRTRAATPAIRGAEALVPVNESVQPPLDAVVD